MSPRITGAGSRDAAQTVPESMYVTPLGGSTGWPSKHLNTARALVRVVDSLAADAGTYPIGRMFLLAASHTQGWAPGASRH